MINYRTFDIVWYFGFFGNLLFAAIFIQSSRLQFNRFKETQKKHLVWFTIGFFSFSTFLFCIAMIYFLQANIQADITNQDSILPILMIIFSDFTLVCFVMGCFIFIERMTKTNLSIILFFAISLLITTVPLYSYTIYWRNGSVLVYFTNKHWEQLHVYTSIFLLGWVLWHCFEKLFILHDELANENIKNRDQLIASFNTLFHMTVAFFILIFLFFLPKTNENSLTNSLNIKIFTFLIFLSFNYFIMFDNNSKKPFTSNRYTNFFSGLILNQISTEEKQNQVKQFKHIIILLFALLISVLIIFNLHRGHEGFVSAEALVNGRLAFHAFYFRDYAWYIHLHGGVIPLIVSIIVLCIRYKISESKKCAMKHDLIMLISIFIISFLLIIGLSSYSYDSFGGFQPVMVQFYLVPIIIQLRSYHAQKENLVLVLNSNTDYISRMLKSNESPFGVYFVLTSSSVIIDLFIQNSDTGKVMIGGNGFIDGIVIVPLLSTLVYTLVSTIIHYLDYFENKLDFSEN